MGLKSCYLNFPSLELPIKYGMGRQRNPSVISIHVNVGICSEADIKADGLTKIFESAKLVVVEMETMIDWWTPVIDALGNVEDAAQCTKGHIGLNDRTVKVTLSRIICALDSYCDAVSLQKSYRTNLTGLE